MANLEGKMALVTGGASGMGRAICLQLEQEGVRVAVADLNLPGAQETVNMLKDPSKHLAVHMDVAKKDSVTKGIAEASEAFGTPPSLLAHCAGYLQLVMPEDLEEEDFDRMIAVHLKGTFLVAQALAKALKTAGTKEGSFMLMSSISAHNPYNLTIHYAAAKAGVISLTKTFAQTLGSDGIRVNTVLPGLIETPIMEEEMMQLSIKATLPQLAIKRVGKPEDVAEMVVFLLSDRSSYITGAEFKVAGGVIPV